MDNVASLEAEVVEFTVAVKIHTRKDERLDLAKVIERTAKGFAVDRDVLIWVSAEDLPGFEPSTASFRKSQLRVS